MNRTNYEVLELRYILREGRGRYAALQESILEEKEGKGELLTHPNDQFHQLISSLLELAA